MSRLFNGTSDVITFAAGGSANLPVGAFSIGMLMRLNSNHRGGLVDTYDAGGFRQLGLNPFDNGSLFLSCNGTTSTAYSGYINVWAALWLTRPSAGGTVRSHLYRYDTLSWTHADLAALGARSAVSSIKVGSFDSGQWLNANMAVMAFKMADLTDLTLENSGLVTNLNGWSSLSPSTLWAFNQANATDPVLDLAGGGATQTASTNPAVSAVEPPGFTYSTPSNATGLFLPFFT